jgi:hypothetical protein
MANFTPSDISKTFWDDPVLQDAEAVEYFDILVTDASYDEKIKLICAAINNVAPDIKNDEIVFSYIKDVFLVFNLFHQQIIQNAREKSALINCQADYINANLSLIGYMTGHPKVNRDAAFRALRKATWALIKIGNLTPTDASSNLLQAAIAARVRACKKQPARRALAKDELRAMGADRLPQSDEAALSVQAELRRRLKSKSYPSTRTIRTLIGELAGEREGQS